MSSQESDIIGSDLLEDLLKEDGVLEGVAHLLGGQVEQCPDSSLNIAAALHMAQTDEQACAAASATGMLPPTDDFSGECSFTVTVEESSYLKYSTSLKKIFVEPVKMVPVKISWNFRSNFMNCKNIFIRAVLVYNDPNRFQEAVKRCVVHRDKDNPWNAGHEEFIDHVIISVNPNSKHEINKDSERRSVLVPLQQPENSTYSLINYKLLCRTSCSRSDMDIIFTLENESGFVLGRQKFGVKICMAPERDLKKEEKKTQPEPKNWKRKRKMILEPEVNIKREISEPSPSCSFMVVAASPEDAALTKDMLKTFNTYQKKLRGKAPIEKIFDSDNVSSDNDNNVPTNSFRLENPIYSDLSDL